jgi:hypothetical protein
MKTNVSVTLDVDLVAAAAAINKADPKKKVSAIINRWAKLGKEQEEKKKPQTK